MATLLKIIATLVIMHTQYIYIYILYKYNIKVCAIRHTTLQVVQKLKIDIYLFNVKGHVHGKYVTSFQTSFKAFLKETRRIAC